MLATSLVLLSTTVILPSSFSDAYSTPREAFGRRRSRPESKVGVATKIVQPPSTITTSASNYTFSVESTSAVENLPYNLLLVQGSSTLHSTNNKAENVDKEGVIDVDGECVEIGLIEYCPSDNEPYRYSPSSLIESVLSTYAGPRVILALVAILYGTNFPLGAIMNDNLPASAATSSRMVLASLVLSPFLFQLKPSLRGQVLVGGAFVSMGYISQSVALIDTSPALVSFLGSATVLVCPFLQWLIDRKPMGMKDAPQTWLAAALCLSGVAALELFDSNTNTFSLALLSKLGTGDALSLVQAVGFGTSVFLSEKMMKKEPDQALPITAGLVSVTAFFAMLWCFSDGWMTQPGWDTMGLPGLFMDVNMRTVALAVLWTGILSTSLNFYIEITALGRVPSSEASVILATEPLWASLFAAILFHEQFGTSDYIGGLLMISACLVNTLRPSDIVGFFSITNTLDE
jgi:drug/metabolite transporter (DMT)-like permease